MIDPCRPIRNAIAELQGEIDRLKAKHHTDSLIDDRQIELDHKRHELRTCEQNYVAPGVFRCDDGGLYYVRSLGNKVYWFGEHKNGLFANILGGERSENEIHGDWFDVPKGRTSSSGQIRLAIDPSNNMMNRIAATGGFAGSRWEPHRPFVNRWLEGTEGYQRPGFEASGISDLTGAWVGSDNGVYYVRQLGDQVVWFGEGPLFTNVFIGTRSGRNITGHWSDVPKGFTASSGTLAIQVDDSETLSRTDATGGFAGTRWSRVECRDLGFPDSLSECCDRDAKRLAVVFDFDGDSCYPSPAVSRNGTMNMGLKLDFCTFLRRL